MHIRLERLPPNSTSVSQPLDAGVISVFKRRYVEMLINKAIVKKYATQKKITNGEAWSLIPYAWSQVKASTLRHCFRTTKVLPKTISDKLEEGSVDVRERQPMYPPEAELDKERMKRHFVRIIASTMDEQEFKFGLDNNQREESDIGEELKEAVRKELAVRDALFARQYEKERSSSVETDDIKSFKDKFPDNPLATIVEGWLASDSPKERAAARLVVRNSKQNNSE